MTNGPARPEAPGTVFWPSRPRVAAAVALAVAGLTWMLSITGVAPPVVVVLGAVVGLGAGTTAVPRGMAALGGVALVAAADWLWGVDGSLGAATAVALLVGLGALVQQGSGGAVPPWTVLVGGAAVFAAAATEPALGTRALLLAAAGLLGGLLPAAVAEAALTRRALQDTSSRSAQDHVGDPPEDGEPDPKEGSVDEDTRTETEQPS